MTKLICLCNYLSKSIYSGQLIDLKEIEHLDTIKICGVDPLSLFLIKSLGEYKFDSYDVNRLGLGLSYGGPHAGFISCQPDLIRFLPGRIVTEAEDKLVLLD